MNVFLATNDGFYVESPSGTFCPPGPPPIALLLTYLFLSVFCAV